MSSPSADNEFHVVEGFYESVASNAQTVLRVLIELAQAVCIGLLHRRVLELR
jgi:hypothetical protein